MRTTAFLALILVTTTLAAKPPTVSGIAKVIDGDSLTVAGNKVRLYGIDAPEHDQQCTQGSTKWPCGTAATEKLRTLVGTDKIDCEQRDIDRYDRIVAICKRGATDLGAAMVSAGLALAYLQYSDAYVDEERAASSAKLGMWGGEFTAPWDYRHSGNDASQHAPSQLSPTQQPQTASAQPSPSSPARNCAIKGNINSHGERIYHLPGTRNYNETVITESKGERWFCSEAEARAAGWRAPRN